MTRLSRLSLLGHDVNVNSRKVIMELPRVKEGKLQIMLSPCLVFVGQSVSFDTEDIETYLNAGCCVYHQGFDPVYPPVKISPGLVPMLGKEGVRIIGKGKAQFIGLNMISTVVGNCFCPAGKKGYYEVTVNECDEIMASFGFCSKNWVFNVQKSVRKDEPWEKKTWGILNDGASLSSDISAVMSDKLRKLDFSAGDVIGLRCEIYGTAKSQAGFQNWDAESVSKSTDKNGSESALEQESNDQLLSAEEIYNLEPRVWESVSNSEVGGKITICVYKKGNPDVLEIELPKGLEGLCPAFLCDSGMLTCNLGGQGCEEFRHPQPGYEAMGSFSPPPVSPNTAGVFTVLHTPSSLPIPARSSSEISKK